MAAGGTETPDAPEKPQIWQLSWRGEKYNEHSLTIAQAEDIEDRLGISWLYINPTRSAKHARVILASMHAARSGEPFDTVFGEVGELAVPVFLKDHLEMVDSDLAEMWQDGNP